MYSKGAKRGFSAILKRAVACIVSVAIAAVGVPVVGHVAEDADDALVVEAYAATDRVLTATVPSEVDGDPAVDLIFTVTGDDTCEVGRSNDSEGASFAVAQGHDDGVVIPEEVVYTNSSGEETTYTVTSIQSYAFGSEDSACSLTDVVIPYTVTTIDTYAFYMCDGLEGLTINSNEGNPSKLENIDDYAFYGCGIQSVCFPNSLVNIGMGAFSRCSSLATVEFEDPTESKLETMGGANSGTASGTMASNYGSAFACTADDPGSIESIILPAGLQSIPPSTFENQADLVEVNYLGDEMCYIGSNAFNGCSSLVEFVVPVLTGDSKSNGEHLGDGAFQGLDSLELIIFKGDAQGNDYSSTAFGDLPSMKTAVFWGDPYTGEYNHSNGTQTGYSETPFGEDVDYYHNVTFYENSSDASKGRNEIASIRLIVDVTIGDIRDVLYGDAEFGEGDVYDDGGALPENSEDYYWAFEDGYIDDSSVFSSPYAWQESKTSDEIDIRACRITLSSSVFTRAQEPIDMTEYYEILAPDGSELSTDCYTTYAIISVEMEDRPDQYEEEVRDDITSLTEEGDYKLYFEAVDGEGYTGSNYADFSIAVTMADFYSYPGAKEYAYELASEIYADEDPSGTVVVASSGDAYGAAAAQWLSSVLDAPFLALPEDTVPDVNTDNYILAALNSLIGNGNSGTIYVVGDEDAIDEDTFEALDGASYATNIQRLSYSDIDAPARVWRAFSQDYESGSHAYVIVDGSGLVGAATQLAYGDASPVFFCDENGELDPYTRFVLKTGRFDDIDILSGSDSAAEEIQEELEYQVGDDAAYSATDGSAQDLVFAAADDYYATHIDETEMIAVFGSLAEGEEGYAVMAAVLSARKDAALFLVASEEEVEEVIPSKYLDEDMAARTGSVVIVGDSDFMDETTLYLSDFWDEEDE